MDTYQTSLLILHMVYSKYHQATVPAGDITPGNETGAIDCPFGCESLRDSHKGPGNAAILQYDGFNIPLIKCQSCADPSRKMGVKGTGIYLHEERLTHNSSNNEVENILANHPDVFTVGSEVRRAFIRGPKNYGVDTLPLVDAIPELYGKPELQRKARDILFTDLFISRNVYTSANLVDSGANKLEFNVNLDEGQLQFLHPPIAADIEDNAFINNYLDIMFQEYSEFIKDWLALYFHTNYRRLPIIVLTGKRDAGKSVFAGFVSSAYSGLSFEWSNDGSQWTSEKTGKLLHMEENESDKKEQYTELKKMLGLGKEQKVSVNVKWGDQYSVRSNANVILTTNAPNPMYFETDELAAREERNGFFIYEPPVLTNPDDAIAYKLSKRIGHYIRTESRKRFEALEARSELDKAKCRYNIACPITDKQRAVYNRNKTETALISDAVHESLHFYDSPYNYFMVVSEELATPKVPAGKYINYDQFVKYIVEFKFGTYNNAKALWNKMLDEDKIIHVNARKAGKRYTYLIAPLKDE